jgi:hypothetical protein
VIGWGIFFAYLLTSALTGRALLRIIMTRPICKKCREGWFTGKCFYHGIYDGPVVRVPFGEVSERPLGIAALATAAGLAWPFTGLVVVVMRASRTPDELARLNAEMSDTIRALEQQLRESS